MRRARRRGRALAGLALLAAAVAVAVVLLRGGDSYSVHVRFTNASQLVKGNLVQVAGVAVGTVRKIDLTEDGQADVEINITDGDFRPLREGTTATVRQASLSGVANRYIDLGLPAADRQQTVPDGGTLDAGKTTSAVDLDELFNTLDPQTRRSLRGVIAGYANSYEGRSADANAGWRYLNPTLIASSRLFEEINRDTPALRAFVDRSASLVTDLAERRTELAGLVDHLATTTSALAARRSQLGDAITRLPPFMRRANTTFVNLRAALDDAAPLVEESKPAVRRLRPFLAQLRPLARDARPTVATLADLVRRDGSDNDLTELMRSTPAVRDIGVGPVQVDGKQRDGALPESAQALGEAAPELAFARPYAVDLTGWFDDFSHSGLNDALGGASRANPVVSGFTNVNGVLKPLLPGDKDAFFAATASLNQRDRCPGSAERGSAWKPTPSYNCNLSQVPPGP